MIKPTSLKDLVNMYIMETDVITFNQPDKHVTDCTFFFFLREREYKLHSASTADAHSFVYLGQCTV